MHAALCETTESFGEKTKENTDRFRQREILEVRLRLIASAVRPWVC